MSVEKPFADAANPSTDDPRIDRALAARTRRPVAMSPALLDALDQDRAPIAPTSALRRVVVPVLAALVAVVGSAVLLPRSGEMTPGMWAQSLALASLGALGLYAVFARGPLGLGLAPRWRWGYVAASLVLFQAVALGTASAPNEPQNTRKQNGSVPRAMEGTVTDGVHQGTMGATEPLGGPGQCASYGTIIAALVGAMMLRSARRTSPVSPESTGASAGVCAGVVGALALHAHAPTDAVHVALAHGAPVLLGAVVGAVVGRRTLAP